MKTKLQDMFAQYGRMGIIVYFAIFFLCFLIFWMILSFGVDIRSWSWFSGKFGNLGSFALAYAATKILQPIRIGLTLVLTPLFAKFFPMSSQKEKQQPKEENTHD